MRTLEMDVLWSFPLFFPSLSLTHSPSLVLSLTHFVSPLSFSSLRLPPASDLSTQQGVVGKRLTLRRISLTQGELKVKHAHDQNRRMTLKRWSRKSVGMKGTQRSLSSLSSVQSASLSKHNRKSWDWQRTWSVASNPTPTFTVNTERVRTVQDDTSGLASLVLIFWWEKENS